MVMALNPFVFIIVDGKLHVQLLKTSNTSLMILFASNVHNY
ncbi:hypothetical protein [Lysinibacillus fusiformis]|nr:hypothetical protein [Lysinibacillus fusiformis]